MFLIIGRNVQPFIIKYCIFVDVLYQVELISFIVSSLEIFILTLGFDYIFFMFQMPFSCYSFPEHRNGDLHLIDLNAEPISYSETSISEPGIHFIQ